jgi:PAS domain S-box-containing protein
METPFAAYFDALPCYLTVQNRELHILHANQRFRGDFGDPLGRRCYQVYKQRSEPCEVCPVEGSFRDGERHRSEERVRCLDGRAVSVLVETTPIRDAAGLITSVLEMSTDITLIKRLEEQLRHSEERHRLLFEEVPCYISIQDRDLRIVETNRAFREAFGESEGRRCHEVYKHRAEECVPCPVRLTFQDGRPHTREEGVTSLRGDPMHMLVTTAPLRDPSGGIASVMEMSADITQVRRLESQLTSLGLLVGSVSHGLKGLLNGLAGGMYLVESGMEKEDRARVRKGWTTVQRNVARIKGMVSDILYYARERAPAWEPVEAAWVADEALGLTEPRAREIGVALERSVSAGAGALEADPQALRSLLVNLLENSLDACRLDAKKSTHAVRLEADGTPDRVAFTVRDTGIGMDRETREKAFTLFFTSKGMEGTGLGLFIAHRIARAHGGAIALASEPGAGTTFTVSLPRKRPASESPDPEIP